MHREVCSRTFLAKPELFILLEDGLWSLTAFGGVFHLQFSCLTEFAFLIRYKLEKLILFCHAFVILTAKEESRAAATCLICPLSY